MDEKLSLFFDESIQLELNAAELYDIFTNIVKDDIPFWWRLCLEERNHAALLKSGKAMFERLGEFPFEMLPPVQQVKEVNKNLTNLIKKYRNVHPTRSEAFSTALEIEQLAGETHFQTFMEEKSDSKIAEIFQQLNRDDKDHAVRLRSYMKDHNIVIEQKS